MIIAAMCFWFAIAQPSKVCVGAEKKRRKPKQRIVVVGLFALLCRRKSEAGQIGATCLDDLVAEGGGTM